MFVKNIHTNALALMDNIQNVDFKGYLWFPWFKDEVAPHLVITFDSLNIDTWKYSFSIT